MIKKTFLTILLLLTLLPAMTFAQGPREGFLPEVEDNEILDIPGIPEEIQNEIDEINKITTNNNVPNPNLNEIRKCNWTNNFEFEIIVNHLKTPSVKNGEHLGCKLKTGVIALGDIPYFARDFASYLIGIVGVLSVLMIVVGGYLYSVSGLSAEQKDKGKATIKYALIGLVLSILSWTIVNIIQFLATS